MNSIQILMPNSLKAWKETASGCCPNTDKLHANSLNLSSARNRRHRSMLFQKVSFPVFFSLFSSFPQTVNRKYWFNKSCRWLDSNCRPLVSEATAQPTEPQPVPQKHALSTCILQSLWLTQANVDADKDEHKEVDGADETQDDFVVFQSLRDASEPREDDCEGPVEVDERDNWKILQSLSSIIFKMAHRRPLFVYFRYLQQINVNKCPSSIRSWDLNPRPLEHESPTINTKPGLPPNCHWLFNI